ncbi:MAG: hypothetical protein GXO36_07400, partial [Chloroflexi bacterium]|nr:hypothetical protein [Chloroflexota bacterium]
MTHVTTTSPSTTAYALPITLRRAIDQSVILCASGYEHTLTYALCEDQTGQRRRWDLVLWLASGLAAHPEAYDVVEHALRLMPKGAQREHLALALLSRWLDAGEDERANRVLTLLSPRERNRVSHALMRRLLRRGAVDQVLAVVRKLPSPKSRVWWLISLAEKTRRPDVRTALVRHALPDAQQIREPVERFRALYHLAQHTDDPELRRALAEAARETLEALEQQHAQDRTQPPDPTLWATLWRMLAEIEVDEERRIQAARRAQAAALEIEDEPWERAYAFIKILPYLPEDEREDA